MRPCWRLLPMPTGSAPASDCPGPVSGCGCRAESGAPGPSRFGRVPYVRPDASLGFDALQATAPLDPDRWVEGIAVLVLPRRCRGKRLAWVGRFRFAAALRALAASGVVLELEPLPGESPAERAADILPRSDLIVGIGMALVNRTPEGRLALCSPGNEAAVVGPSVPRGEVLVAYGISLLCGCCVEQPQRVMAGIRQGAHFHHSHPDGTRLVTMEGRANLDSCVV
jgi:uncharacterized protein (DUF4213/DUF364 family)